MSRKGGNWNSAKVEAKQLEASEQGVQNLYCSQNEFRFGQARTKTILAKKHNLCPREKVAPGSFSGPRFQFQFQFQLLCVENKTRLCNSLLSQFLHKIPTKSQNFSKFKFEHLVNKSFSLFVEQGPGSFSSPEVVPWRRIHQVLNTLS